MERLTDQELDEFRRDPQTMYRRMYERVRDHIATEGLTPEHVWGTMTYGCADGCGFQRTVQLGIGVEGTRTWKDEDYTIPCPFMAGKCPRCGRMMSHIQWFRDTQFPPRPRGAIDSQIPYFRVPSLEKSEEYVRLGYGGAELVEPLPLD